MAMPGQSVIRQLRQEEKSASKTSKKRDPLAAAPRTLVGGPQLSETVRRIADKASKRAKAKTGLSIDKKSVQEAKECFGTASAKRRSRSVHSSDDDDEDEILDSDEDNYENDGSESEYGECMNGCGYIGYLGCPCENEECDGTWFCADKVQLTYPDGTIVPARKPSDSRKYSGTTTDNVQKKTGALNPERRSPRNHGKRRQKSRKTTRGKKRKRRSGQGGGRKQEGEPTNASRTVNPKSSTNINLSLVLDDEEAIASFDDERMDDDASLGTENDAVLDPLFQVEAAVDDNEEEQEDDERHRESEYSYLQRNIFNPDAKLTMAHVVSLIGDGARRMSNKEKQANFDWIESLKDKCANWMRTHAERKICQVAERDPTIRDTSFVGLQMAWAKMNVRDKKQLSRMAGSFWKLSKPGATKFFPKSWDIDAEALFMKQNKFRYANDGTKLDKLKGCIARTAGRAIRNARKKLFAKAKKAGGHGLTISANDQGVKGVKKDVVFRRQDLKFKPQYCRPRNKSSTADDEETEEEDEDNEREESDEEEDSFRDSSNDEDEIDSDDDDSQTSNERSRSRNRRKRNTKERSRKRVCGAILMLLLIDYSFTYISFQKQVKGRKRNLETDVLLEVELSILFTNCSFGGTFSHNTNYELPRPLWP
jgi:hypothetical protein